MLGWMIEIFISSILQSRPNILLKEFVCFLLSEIKKKDYFFKFAKKTQDIQMLGRIIKISVSSILQSRPSIIKKIFCLVEQCLFFQFCKKYTVYLSSFLLGRKIKICFLQIYQAVWAIFYSLFCILSKINQGSCLGCLGGDDAPAMCLDSCN